MVYSINIDWREEFSKDCEKWINHTAQIVRGGCNHHTQEGTSEDCFNVDYSGWCEECDISEDSCEPMMNYGYPLETDPTEEEIKECYEETGLIVMENSETEEHYLVLTGGGMDLSQNIGLAYIIVDRWIPEDLINNIHTQKALSLGKENFAKLQVGVIEQLKNYEERFKTKRKEWEGIK